MCESKGPTPAAPTYSPRAVAIPMENTVQCYGKGKSAINAVLAAAANTYCNRIGSLGDVFSAPDKATDENLLLPMLGGPLEPNAGVMDLKINLGL